MGWLDKLKVSVDWVTALLLTHFLTIAGFLLALVILGRLFEEKRQPSNIFAWSLLILAIPYLGVPLYFLVGGRKIRKLTREKERFNASHSEEYPKWICMEEGGDHHFPPVIGGNQVQLITSGEEMFQQLCVAIEDASSSIRLSTYIFGNDEVGKDLIARLARKARQGVEVKLLLDGMGSFGRNRTVCKPLRKAGGDVAVFLPVLPLQTHWSANLRNHRKLAIFDHEMAIIGGQNLDTRFIGPTPTPDRFDDCAVTITGPSVAEINRLFAGDWGFATRRPATDFLEQGFRCPLPCGDSRLQVVASGPDVPKDPLYEEILKIIQEARDEVVLVTPYFVPDEVIFRSLMVKAHSGKRVTLITPERSNHSFLDQARNSYLRDLQEAGVRIYGYQPRMLHAKVIWVDGRIALVGSANVDQRSLFLNFEIGIFLHHKKDVDQIEKWIQSLGEHCRPLRITPLAKLSLRRRVVENFAYLTAPLL